MSTNATQWILAASFVLAAMGFLLPFWPLSVVGILLAGLSGRWIFAFAIGLLLDVAYGAPMGTLAYAVFPFTIVALLSVVGRSVGMKYLLSKHLPDKL